MALWEGREQTILRPRSHGTGSVWSPYQFEKSQDEQ